MRNTIILIACIALFAHCRSKVEVHPTETYDTLGIQWLTIEREHIVYYFQGTGKEGASIFTDLHEDAYEQLLPVFEPNLPRKVRFFVWTDWEQAEVLLNHFPGFALPYECVCHIRANQSLGHEMTHILSYWAWGTEAVTYSRFINEGVAVAFNLEDYDKMQDARDVVGNYYLNSIRDLWGDNGETAPEDLLYPVGGAFIDYIYKLNEPDKFRLLIKNQTLEDAELIYGKERLDALIAGFDSELGLG